MKPFISYTLGVLCGAAGAFLGLLLLEQVAVVGDCCPHPEAG